MAHDSVAAHRCRFERLTGADLPVDATGNCIAAGCGGQLRYIHVGDGSELFMTRLGGDESKQYANLLVCK